MIKEFPFTVEYRLVQTVDLPAEDFLVGGIIAYCKENCLTEEASDLKKISSFILKMSDKKYRGHGQDIGATGGMEKTDRKRGQIILSHGFHFT